MVGFRTFIIIADLKDFSSVRSVFVRCLFKRFVTPYLTIIHLKWSTSFDRTNTKNTVMNQKDKKYKIPRKSLKPLKMF